MKLSIHLLNDFYQGLKLLMDFETNQTHGAMSVEFYAINKIVAHFNSAMEQGDVIAPFFLHYVADKYPAYVDKSQLPDLSSLPSHRSQAPLWIKDYKVFVALYQQIDAQTQPRVIECRTMQQAKLKQANMKRQLSHLMDKVLRIVDSESAIGGLFAAKLLQRFQPLMEDTPLTTLIEKALEKSAFYPNVLAMYEFAQFIKDNQLSLKNQKMQKLARELKVLEETEGNIFQLTKLYEGNENIRFLSQWMLQSSFHGQVDLATCMIEQYLFNDEIQWIVPISKDEQLLEAIKWYNVFEVYASTETQIEYWQKLCEKDMLYEALIGKDKNRAYFLCLLIEKMQHFLKEQFQSIPQSDFLDKYQDILRLGNYYQSIFELTWELHNHCLPKSCPSFLLNEIALILEARHDYRQAESLYRKAYALDKDNATVQYNLANILSKQNKNKKEQIQHFFEAARQGCVDSVCSLFKLLVVDGVGSVEQLETLLLLMNKADTEEGLNAPKGLLIHFIHTAIFQKINYTEIVEWVVKEKDGKLFFDAIFSLEDPSSEAGDVEIEPKLEPEPTISAQSSSPELAQEQKSQDKAVRAEKNKTKSTSVKDAGHRSRLFKPAETDRVLLEPKKERALRKLDALNGKGIRNLNIKDFMEAKKAYQTLMGENAGLDISNKGKTSGSRISIGDEFHFHRPHGRDRMSIGAQREIKLAISGLAEKAKFGHSQSLSQKS